MKRKKRSGGPFSFIVSAFSRNFGLKMLSLALAILIYCVLSPKSERHMTIAERMMAPVEAGVTAVAAEVPSADPAASVVSPVPAPEFVLPVPSQEESARQPQAKEENPDASGPQPGPEEPQPKPDELQPKPEQEQQENETGNAGE